jgi:hypothetical protein
VCLKACFTLVNCIDKSNNRTNCFLFYIVCDIAKLLETPKVEKNCLDSIQMKKCKVCELVKEFSEFSKNGKYYRANCKNCKPLTVTTIAVTVVTKKSTLKKNYHEKRNKTSGTKTLQKCIVG